MIYAYIVGIFFMSILLATIIIPRILFISYKKRLFDIPDTRKIHNIPISPFRRTFIFSGYFNILMLHHRNPLLYGLSGRYIMGVESVCPIFILCGRTYFIISDWGSG